MGTTPLHSIMLNRSVQGMISRLITDLFLLEID